jgi:hypothetical protein
MMRIRGMLLTRKLLIRLLSSYVLDTQLNDARSCKTAKHNELAATAYEVTTSTHTDQHARERRDERGTRRSVGYDG